MREAEMRRRIERGLKRRMRGILAPTLGLGLAIVGFGCGGTEYGAQFPRNEQPRLDAGYIIPDATGTGMDAPIDAAVDAAPVDDAAGNETPPLDTGEMDASSDVERPVDRG